MMGVSIFISRMYSFNLNVFPHLPAFPILNSEGAIPIEEVFWLNPDLGILMDTVGLLHPGDRGPDLGDQDVDLVKLGPALAC